ncbi:GNAT family N-acetyltransferase [Clostridium sp. YIM B02515]|uniref:GNAT family N-acetyltransferase n=1 Tax=Clostridium rhizosphaerae TaxID=2803861 RepID=A0ABS1TD66_9CLOT|nr:GNAT family N-acetyltransferase [Clostridium rhizosphaerae]MBL4937299.1 GNAT family N-acetyltransferase [Clostridium rhizosphaerae]
MIKKLDLKNIETAEQVLKIQFASYKIEVDIIGFYDIPTLKDTVDSLKECDEIFYGYYLEDRLAGIISYKIFDNILDIHRVAVHPDFFRRGVAGELISFVEKVDNNIEKIIVCTGKDNLPAVKLYIKNRFKKNKDIEVSKNFYLTEFEKVL